MADKAMTANPEKNTRTPARLLDMTFPRNGDGAGTEHCIAYRLSRYCPGLAA